MASTIFGTDRPLLYNIDPWNELGFACPNFSHVMGTISQPIWGLADEIGRVQLFIMTHQDAARSQPPSMNTVMRLGKICNRVHSILIGRMKADNELRLEAGHHNSDLLPWNIHPCPFFNSAITRNRWLKEYSRLCMTAMTNIYQHSDNNLSLTITAKFASDIWQYFNEIKMLVAMELLQLDPTVVKADNFVFEQQHYDGYTPSNVTINMEHLDTPGPLEQRATEVDLRPLFEGIPSTIILPALTQYPVGPAGEGFSGSPLPESSAAPGTPGGTAIAAMAPGQIGAPQI